MNKEKLYLIIIIIFLIIFSGGIVFYAHTHNAGLTKTILSRVASFGPLWFFDSNESLSENKKYITKKILKDNLPKKLFGVAILDNPKKYLYETAQGREKDYDGILKHKETMIDAAVNAFQRDIKIDDSWIHIYKQGSSFGRHNHADYKTPNWDRKFVLLHYISRGEGPGGNIEFIFMSGTGI